jgi:hypothetical protein
MRKKQLKVLLLGGLVIPSTIGHIIKPLLELAKPTN